MRELNCVDPWGYFAKSVHSGGRVVNWHELPVVTILKDLGWLRSWSVFETMVARKEVVFHLDDYLERLCASIKTMCLRIPASVSDDNFKRQIAEAVKEVLLRNQYRWRVCDQSLVKIIVTGGQTHDGFTPADFASVFIVSEKFKRPEFEGKGLRLMWLEDRRAFPNIKTPGNYAGALRGMDFENFDDVLYYSSSGLLETSRANLFFVSDNVITTVGSVFGIMKGVTRQIVLSLAAGLGYGIHQKTWVETHSIFTASEVFITSTTKGVWPVSSINNARSSFPVGPVTLKLRENFLEYEEKYYQK